MSEQQQAQGVWGAQPDSICNELPSCAMTEIDGWKAFEVVSGMFVSLLGVLGLRSMARIDKLEKTYVSREDLKDAMAEMRADRKAMHDENTTHLDRIEANMAQNEARDAQTRHDIRETVNSVSTQLAVLVALAKERDKHTHYVASKPAP